MYLAEPGCWRPAGLLASHRCAISVISTPTLDDAKGAATHWRLVARSVRPSLKREQRRYLQLGFDQYKQVRRVVGARVGATWRVGPRT